jgi:hypothetical protein
MAVDREAKAQDLEQQESELKLAGKIADLQEELRVADTTELQAEAQRLPSDLEAMRERQRQAWKLSCDQVAEQDTLLVSKGDREELAAFTRAPRRGSGETHSDTAAPECSH